LLARWTLNVGFACIAKEKVCGKCAKDGKVFVSIACAGYQDPYSSSVIVERGEEEDAVRVVSCDRVEKASERERKRERERASSSTIRLASLHFHCRRIVAYL
jgi:hypothetical protein